MSQDLATTIKLEIIITRRKRFDAEFAHQLATAGSLQYSPVEAYNYIEHKLCDLLEEIECQQSTK
jgi:hypothetical protein